MKCPLMAHAAPYGCDKCGKKLRGKQRRWCSTACSLWFLRNHRWSNARAECRRKAHIRGSHGMYRCAAEGGCTTTAPEVNHKTPCLGRHGTVGCHHHQEGLECLCHTHHLAVTAAQRAAGLFSVSSKVGS